MKIELTREEILKPLQAIIGVVERRQTMPILANVLLQTEDDAVILTATDLEVEMVARGPARTDGGIATAVPGRKLLDICRSLPDGVPIGLALDSGRLRVQAGRSRFSLATLPADEFPVVESMAGQASFTVEQRRLKWLFEQTQFSMAQQDVRYYLNGLLLEFGPRGLRGVATDGHRLALADVQATMEVAESRQVILPRKAVVELGRLLAEVDDAVHIEVGQSHLRAGLGTLRFTSKLIDGRFPDYERVIPKGGDKELAVDRLVLRQALARAAILSNEKYRGVHLMLERGGVKVTAHNAEQESAEEEIEADYSGDPLEIGFNVTYLLDPLNAMDGDQVRLTFMDANSSCVLEASNDSSARYVVMPMRL